MSLLRSLTLLVLLSFGVITAVSMASLTPRLIPWNLNLRSRDFQPTLSITRLYHLGATPSFFCCWSVGPWSRGCVQCDEVSVAIIQW